MAEPKTTRKIKWFDRYTILVLLILMMVASLVISSGYMRYQEALLTQEELAQASARAAVDEIALLVRELRRSVRIFALEKVNLISALAQDPDNKKLQVQLRNRLETHFPEYFSATITDEMGMPLTSEFGDGVGRMCQLNLEEFAIGDHPQQIMIHPSPMAYHFDVMTHWHSEKEGEGELRGVFFVSFHPTLIAKILERAVTPGHQLLLVKRDDPTLVEVTAFGAGDKNARDSHLSVLEQQHILVSRPVAESSWDLLDITSPALLAGLKTRLMMEEGLVFLLFMFVSLLMLYLVKREAYTRDQAVAVSREKSEFLSTMSHEIRTPLNSVIGFAELLSGTSLNSLQREYVDSVKNSGETLLSLINDILDLSKIEANKLEMEQVAFGLREWLDGIMNLFSEQANSRGLELAAVVPHDLPNRITGDPTHLQQVLVNLVGNAIKFTEAGSVVVRVSRLPSSGPDAAENDCLLRFSVEDTGIGIDPEKKARLFDQFTQADDSTTRQYGGTGLGLAISLRLVGLMRGLIDVEARAQGGSEFWFSVPLKCEEDERIGECRHFGGKQRDTYRALLIENSPVYNELLGEHLQRLGCPYKRAKTGTEGLALLRNGLHSEHPFDLVIMELNTPGLGGVDLSRLIAADPETKGLPLIIMGSMAGEEAAAARKEPGISRLLHKPVGLHHLMTAMADALGLTLSDSFQQGVEVISPKLGLVFDGVRILVVDDNELNLRVASGMLHTLSCEVHTATSGAGALTMAAKIDFDLVFMDCEMPEMDGFEATKRLKQMGIDRDGKKTPVVAMTANAVAGDRERCLVADFDDYLPKPITIRSVKDMLLKWGLASSPSKDSAAETVFDSVFEALILNQAVLEKMRGLASDQDPTFFSELLVNFRQESEQRLQEIESRIEEQDSEAIRQAVHSLKGTAGLVGAERLEQACEITLMDARAGELGAMSSHYKALNSELAKVLESLPED